MPRKYSFFLSEGSLRARGCNASSNHNGPSSAFANIRTPGGSLHLLDFESSEDQRQGVLARWLHSSHRLKDNSERKIVELMKALASHTQKGCEWNHPLRSLATWLLERIRLNGRLATRRKSSKRRIRREFGHACRRNGLHGETLSRTAPEESPGRCG